MFFLGGNFVSRLIWTLKSKKPKKTLKNLKNLKPKNFFLKNLGFFQPWGTPVQEKVTMSRCANAVLCLKCDIEDSFKVVR